MAQGPQRLAFSELAMSTTVRPPTLFMLLGSVWFHVPSQIKKSKREQ